MRKIFLILMTIISTALFGQEQQWYQLNSTDPFPGTGGNVNGIDQVGDDLVVTGKFSKAGMVSVAKVGDTDTLMTFQADVIPGAEDERVRKVVDRMGATYAVTESGVFRHYSTTGWESVFPDNWVLDYPVTSGALWEDNIFVGGHFTEFTQFGVGQQAVQHCFYYNGDTVVAASVPEVVRSMKVIEDTLYAFTLQKVYTWNGEEWKENPSIEKFDAYRLWDIETCGSTTYLAGHFDEVARVITIDSVEVGQFRMEEANEDGRIRDMLCHRDTLYVTGSWLYAIKGGNGVEAPGVAYLAPGAETWSPLGDGLIDEDGNPQGGLSLGKRGSSVYVGGSFNRIDSIWVGSIARWGPGSFVDTTGDTTKDTTDTTGVGVIISGDINLVVSPNPVSSTLVLEFSRAVFLDAVVLYGINGRQYRIQNINSPKKRHTVDVSQLPKGMYILKVKGKDGIRKSIRIVKQ